MGLMTAWPLYWKRIFKKWIWRRGQQRMRSLDGITYSMNMSMSKLQEIVEYGGAWCTVVHGVIRSQTLLRDWRTTIYICITDSLWCTLETNTTLLINKTPVKILKTNYTMASSLFLSVSLYLHFCFCLFCMNTKRSRIINLRLFSSCHLSKASLLPCDHYAWGNGLFCECLDSWARCGMDLETNMLFFYNIYTPLNNHHVADIRNPGRGGQWRNG